MVISDTGFPDPENPNDELTPNSELVFATDTDTDGDEEENIYDGYQPLPLSEFDSYTSEEDTETVINDDTPNEVGAEGDSLPPITRAEDVIVKEVWSAPPPPAVDIEMDSNRVNEVRQAMLNITLPASSIPDWASNIPEDQWKQQLMRRLQTIKKNN